MIGAEGQTFEAKDILKQHGFQWNQDTRQWERPDWEDDEEENAMFEELEAYGYEVDTFYFEGPEPELFS